MAQQNKGNYNALTWLQDELQQSLALALNAMNKFIDEPASTTFLSDCIEAIYQVKGTLEMLNLMGATMLAEEIQQAVAAIRDNKVQDPQTTQEAVIKALLLMPNYLKMLNEDFPDHPLSLIENINELRKLRELPEYQELSLFTPSTSIPLPERVAPNPLRRLPKLKIANSQLSHVYQIHLLNWLKTHSTDNLQKMRNITHFLRLASQEEKTTILWWSAETLIDALIHEGLEETAQIKSLLGKLSKPIKTQSSQDEKTLLLAYPNDLLNQLLLTTAKATTQSASVALLKQTFGLNFYDQRQKIYGMSDNALSNAHHALLEQLQEIKAEIDQYDENHDNLAILQQVTEQLHSMSDTLALLEEYEASNLLHHQFETLEVIVSIEQQPDEATLTDLADALLKVENLIQASDNITVNDELRNAVIGECLLEMSNIKEALTLASQNQQVHVNELVDIASQLNLISGSLNMLNYPEAAIILNDTAQKISDYAANDQLFNQSQLDLLAEILACCDLFMEGISQHGQALTNLLNDASEKLLDFDTVDSTPHDRVVSAEEQIETDSESTISSSAESENDETHFAEGLDQEIAEIFIEEANEVLNELKHLLPAWLQQQDSSHLPDIRRHFHTLKGSGRMAGASVIGELGWSVEQVLNHVLQGTAEDSPQVKQLVSDAYEHIPELLNRFAHANLDSDASVDALSALSQQCLSKSSDEADNYAEQPITEADLSILEFDSPELEMIDIEPAPPAEEIVDTTSPASLESTLDFEIEPVVEQNTLDNIALDIPLLDSDADHTLIFEEEPDIHADSFESETEIKTDAITSVERYIRNQNIDLESTSDAEQDTQNISVTIPAETKPFTSVDRYILQLDRQQTSVDRYIKNKQAEAPKKKETKPFTSVDRYLLQLNRQQTSVDRYISEQQQPVYQTEQTESPLVKETQPFTSVDRYILHRNRPLTKVDLYIQARSIPTEEANEIEVPEDTSALTEAQELQQIFKSEAKEHITALIVEMSQVKKSQRITKQALRSIHSLKGCANIAGVTPMAIVATEMNAVFDRLHSHDVSLTESQVDIISSLIAGLDQILLSLDGLANEPDIAQLGTWLDQLAEADSGDDNVQLIDPEFLVAFLEETDELLENYTTALSHWFNEPNDQENNLGLEKTLKTLQDGAEQLEQTTIASIYIALDELIKASQPDADGLKQLLELGYEELNQLIEKLIQNKPITENSSFPEKVSAFLTREREPVTAENEFIYPDDNIHVEETIQLQDIDETEFAIPAESDMDILEAFTEEASELLASSDQCIKSWQAGQDVEHVTLQLQRDLHTIKGGARLAGISPMADLTHHVETLVQTVLEQQYDINEEFYDLLIRCQDKLTEMQEQLAGRQAVTTAVSLIAEIEMFSLRGTDASFTAPQPQDFKSTSTVLDLDETEFAIPEDIDQDLLEAFTEEAHELLVSSDQAIKQWLGTIQTDEAIQQLQRDLHTLKGGARLAGISPMADLTHKVETLVNSVTQNEHLENEDFFDLLQRCQDKLTEMQEQLAAKDTITTAISLMAEIDFLIGEETAQPVSVVESVKSHANESVHPSPASPESVPSKATHTEQVRVKADVLDDLTNYAGEISISRDRVTQQHLAMQSDLQEMEYTVNKLRDQLRKLEIETEAQILFRYEDEQLKKDQEFDPLELDRFSTIQQLSRSLTESATDLIDISESMSNLGKETDALLLQQARLNSDLQHGLMHTRLLPFATITPRMERIVRQTAAELGKKTEFSVSGTDLEIDRAILDRLVAPIEHILRNAIAHGVESPQQREAAGKNPAGSLQLQIKREGSEMILTVQDDGQGIDVEKIKQKALSQGLIDEQNIPTDDELVQLILTSGFSTADSISQVAGRGVGMDVVSNEIRALKGRLSIQTKHGKGTTFNIRLPLTLSVTQALLVSVQGEQYALPLGTVNAGERIRVSEIKTLLESERPKYTYDDEEYDFIPLATLLDKSLKLPEQETLQLPLLLFRSGESKLALLIDTINGNREIVIKPIGKQLAHIHVINGATILGDGRVVFILDIPTLTDIALEKRVNNQRGAISLEKDLQRIQQRPPTAMVVDDSITVRKATSNLMYRLGFEVMTAKDGVDALSQLHTQVPDIILLDVEMPRMDGFEFASMVRNDIKFRHIPIIMITSRTGDKHRDRAKEIGVNAYLGKPFQEEQLVDNMKQLLGERFSQGNA